MVINLREMVIGGTLLIPDYYIAGKGIKEIEYDFHWHGKPPTKEEEQKFLKELRTLKGTIEASHND